MDEVQNSKLTEVCIALCRDLIVTFVGVTLGRLLAVERGIVIWFPSKVPCKIPFSHVNVGLALRALVIW